MCAPLCHAPLPRPPSAASRPLVIPPRDSPSATWQPAERFVNPLSLGIPTIGALSHASSAEVALQAERVGAADGIVGRLLARDATDALAKATALLTDPAAWSRAQAETTAITAGLDQAGLRKVYDDIANSLLGTVAVNATVNATVKPGLIAPPLRVRMGTSIQPAPPLQ